VRSADVHVRDLAHLLMEVAAEVRTREARSQEDAGIENGLRTEREQVPLDLPGPPTLLPHDQGPPQPAREVQLSRLRLQKEIAIGAFKRRQAVEDRELGIDRAEMAHTAGAAFR